MRVLLVRAVSLCWLLRFSRDGDRESPGSAVQDHAAVGFASGSTPQPQGILLILARASPDCSAVAARLRSRLTSLAVFACPPSQPEGRYQRRSATHLPLLMRTWFFRTNVPSAGTTISRSCSA